MPDLVSVVRKHVPSLLRTHKALEELEATLGLAETYEELRGIERKAEAIRVLFHEFEGVRHKAEDVILTSQRRIGDELQKIPPGSGRPNKTSAHREVFSPRAAALPDHHKRSKLGQLARIPAPALEAAKVDLRGRGRDVTADAVLAYMAGDAKARRRAEREQTLATRITALPDARFGVIYADPEWQFAVRSEATGRDRSAENHYPTSPLEVIKARPVAKIAAPDCALFLWATVPMLPQALAVMAAWGFAYASSAVWVKDQAGTGYWFRNRHELLLLGTRGNIPCPAPGGQWNSVIEAPAARHSQKPDDAAEMIEAYFPTLPKIELNRRGPPRAGWTAWGNEAENLAAAE